MKTSQVFMRTVFMKLVQIKFILVFMKPSSFHENRLVFIEFMPKH